MMRIARRLHGAPLAAILACPLVLAACQPASDQESLEEANLEKALFCMRTLEVELDLDTFARECLAEGYIQHAPHIPDGKQGFIDYFAGRLAEYPDMHLDIKRAAADGDLVWIHGHFKRSPDALGSAVVQIFRMEDGKFAEHWGVSRAVQEESVNGNSIF